MGHERTFRSQRSDVRSVTHALLTEDMRLFNDLICGREQLRASRVAIPASRRRKP